MNRTFSRVLVTGAAGQLGRHLLPLLADVGVSVTALDIRPDHVRADRMVVGDAGDPAVVRAAMEGVDAVVHLAAIPAPTLASSVEVFAGNSRATFVVLDEAARAGVNQAVIASSVSVTGLPWSGHELHPAYLPIDEALPLQVSDPYALSKEADEATAAMINRKYGMTVTALRFPLLGRPDDKLSAAARRYAVDPGSGARELWSYLDYRDAARACWLGLVRPASGSHVVFVAAPETLAAIPTEELLDRFHPGVPRCASVPGRSVPIELTAARRLLGFSAEYLCPASADVKVTEIERQP